MNKIFFLLLPLFLFAKIIKFPYTVNLKKDEFIDFKVYYGNFSYDFKFKWTLYKNNTLTIIYFYNNFVHHITLFKNSLNTFKVDISKINDFNPYFYIKFKRYNDKIATFKIYLFNGKNVKVELKE